MKKLLLLFLLISNSSFASEDACIEISSLENEVSSYNTAIATHFKLPYYLYFEADNLEELQTLKNCIDYSKCGKSKSESIVDDPKNYRMHITDRFTQKELQEFIDQCPIPNMKKKLTIRETNKNGNNVSVYKSFFNIFYDDSEFRERSNPAIFKKVNETEAKNVLAKITTLLAAKKTTEANALVLKTWDIALHGYSISYTGKDGSYATANHQNRKIEYSNDWLKNPCDFIRMIRHEAEHVAQMNQSKRCGGDHNFSDHRMRERATHLNDARFAPTVCPNTPMSESIRNFCINRFKTRYSN